MKDLKTVFREHIQVKIDRRFVRKVLTHVDDYMRSSEDTISFLGGNLIGVYSLKYLEEDRLRWVEDILDIADYEGLREDIFEVPGIDRSFHVSSDAVNLSMIYIVHMALISKELNAREREQLASAVMNLLQIKFLSSIHTRYFKYPANEDIALAVYEQLDRKSTLKRYGTWMGVIQSRTDVILDSGTLHSNTIRKLDDSGDVVKMVNDIQGRIKSIMNKLTELFYKIRDTDSRIISRDKFILVDGETLIRDSINKYDSMISRVHDIVPDTNALIDDRLVKVITEVLPTVSAVHLVSTLTYLSENYNVKRKSKEFREFIEGNLLYTFTMIKKEKIALTDTISIAIKLKSLYRSSRANDPLLLKTRELGGSIVEDALGGRGESLVASTRVGFMLYIVLRALMK